MKKIPVIMGVAVCFAVVFLLVVSQPRRVIDTPPPLTKIGMILGGSKTDQGYTQFQYEAAEAVCERENLAFVCYDQVPSQEGFAELAERLIEEGCGMILCDSDRFDPVLAELVTYYPDVSFLNISGTVTAKNLSACLGRLYQSRYLCGIVAGLQTRTNEIGYVLASLTPETICQLNAFVIGVRKVNPEAVVYVRHTDSLYDSKKAASVTAALLDAHAIDVLTQHVNPVSPLRVADERGVYTIGNSRDSRTLFPRTFLTSCLFDWESFLTRRIAERRENRFEGRNYWESIRTGLVSLAPLSEQVNAGTAAVIEAELEKLMNGEFDVFYGPVTDIYGTVQVREGENLSDEHLLYGMYWFVDGVVME